MPSVGDVQRGRGIGYNWNSRNCSRKYIYVRCPECGFERWTASRIAYKTPIVLCHHCTFKKTRQLGKLGQGFGEKSPKWRGGREITTKGYVKIWVDSNNPYFGMATHQVRGKTGYILEHRLVMASKLGRCLLKSETVHHINGIKDDNRIENLQLISPADHMTYDKLCSQCSLRKEIRLLRWQLKELQTQIQGKLIKED